MKLLTSLLILGSVQVALFADTVAPTPAVTANTHTVAQASIPNTQRLTPFGVTMEQLSKVSQYRGKVLREDADAKAIATQIATLNTKLEQIVLDRSEKDNPEIHALLVKMAEKRKEAQAARAAKLAQQQQKVATPAVTVPVPVAPAVSPAEGSK